MRAIPAAIAETARSAEPLLPFSLTREGLSGLAMSSFPIFTLEPEDEVAVYKSQRRRVFRNVKELEDVRSKEKSN